jgi:hypothetical protein
MLCSSTPIQWNSIARLRHRFISLEGFFVKCIFVSMYRCFDIFLSDLPVVPSDIRKDNESEPKQHSNETNNSHQDKDVTVKHNDSFFRKKGYQIQATGRKENPDCH